MTASGLNLTSVDEAFGERADLYRDVLRIKSDATTDQIQQAYFQRRDELFQVLAKMDQSGVPPDSFKRYRIERQMDAVVMALRVLGDADARLKYDFMRGNRVSGRHILSPSVSLDEDDVPLSTGTSLSYSETSNGTSRRRLKSAMKKSRSLDDGHSRKQWADSIGNARSVDHYEIKGRSRSEASPPQVEETEIRKVISQDEVSRASKSSRKSMSSKSFRRNMSYKGGNASIKSNGSLSSSKRKTRKLRPPRGEESEEDVRGSKTHKRFNDDDASQGSQGTTLSVMESRRSIFEVVRDEITGAVEDTKRSFEMVFGAFTLQDEEIKAVFGRIDKAKREIEDEFA